MNHTNDAITNTNNDINSNTMSHTNDTITNIIVTVIGAGGAGLGARRRGRAVKKGGSPGAAPGARARVCVCVCRNPSLYLAGFLAYYLPGKTPESDNSSRSFIESGLEIADAR